MQVPENTSNEVKSDSYAIVERMLTTVFGDARAAVDVLLDNDWTLDLWARWASEVQCGHYADPELGIVQQFRMSCDDFRLTDRHQGTGDNVATALASLCAWMGVDDLLPEGSEQRMSVKIGEYFGVSGASKATAASEN